MRSVGRGLLGIATGTLSFAVLLVACAKDPQKPREDHAGSSDDTAVITTVLLDLNQYYQEAARRDPAFYEGKNSFVLSDESEFFHDTVKEKAQYVADVIILGRLEKAKSEQSYDASMESSFLSANMKPMHVHAAVEIGSFIVKDKKELSRLEWEDFHKVFPTAHGIVSFTMPGYSADHKRALIHLSISCGMLCGHGRLYYLRLKEGQWIIERSEITWVS